MKRLLILISMFYVFADSYAQMSIVWEQNTKANSYYNAQIEKITYDSENNIILAGYSWYGVYNSNQTVFVMKMNQAGDILWLQRFMGEGVGDYDNATVNGLYLDSEDNIIMFAKYFSQKVIKYDKDGNFISADDYTFDIPFTINVYNQPYLFDQVHRNPGGYFILGGLMNDYDSRYSYYAEFDPQGKLWKSTVDTTNIVEFNPTRSYLSYYDDYRLYLISGCYYGATYPYTPGISLSSMTSEGKLEWSKPNWFSDDERWPLKMLRSDDGYTYVATYFNSDNGSSRGSYLTKLDPIGELVWEEKIDTVQISDMEFDNGGNIWVLGYGTNSNESYLLKYSTAKERLVNKVSTAYLNRELVVNENNDVYFAVITSQGIFLKKHAWNGDELSEIKLTSNINSTVSVIQLNVDNDLLVSFNYLENISIMKITDEATGINEETTSFDYKLLQNYPNPFNPSTLIEFSIPQSEFVTLKVFNSIGEEVAELVNGELQTGFHSVNFNAKNLSSGIYFYRIQTNNFIKTNKMLLLK